MFAARSLPHDFAWHSASSETSRAAIGERGTSRPRSCTPPPAPRTTCRVCSKGGWCSRPPMAARKRGFIRFPLGGNSPPRRNCARCSPAPSRHETPGNTSGSRHAIELRNGSRHAAHPTTRQQSFRYPGGRYWSVAEYVIRQPSDGEGPPSQSVLRFTAGARSLDVTAWPGDWRSYSDYQLSDLLWRSFPRDMTAPTQPGEFRRRRGELDAQP